MLLQVASAAAAAAEPKIKMEVPDDMTIFLVGVAAALFFLLVAIVVARVILYTPSRKDLRTRRVWFWIFGVLSLITTFVLLFFVFQPATAQDLRAMGMLKIPADYAQYDAKFMHYTKMYPISVIVSFVLYVGLGFCLSKMFKTKKIGDWF